MGLEPVWLVTAATRRRPGAMCPNISLALVARQARQPAFSLSRGVAGDRDLLNFPRSLTEL